MTKSKPTIRMQIAVINPPQGVRFALQCGASTLIDPKESVGENLLFEFPLIVADAESVPVRFTGDFAQGPPAARLVYINSGTLSGQMGSCWTRRAKVPLSGVPNVLLAEALANGRQLKAEIFGRAKDGGPVCASVKLLKDWVLH